MELEEEPEQPSFVRAVTAAKLESRKPMTDMNLAYQAMDAWVVDEERQQSRLLQHYSMTASAHLPKAHRPKLRPCRTK